MFGISEQTPFLVFTNIVMLFLIFNTTKQALHPPYVIDKSNRKITIFLFFVFSLFSFWGADWFGYIEAYQLVVNYGYEHTHMESVYVWIIQNLASNYMLFRIIVWGGALVLFYDTVRRLSVNKSLVLFIFGCAYLCWFSYARVSLAMAMAFWGASLLYKPYYKRKNVSSILGVCAIACSFFFHKTAFFAIVVVLLAYIMMHLNRRWLVVVLLLIPALVVAMQSFFGDVLPLLSAESDNESMNQIVQSGQRKIDLVRGASGPGALIRAFFERTPYYILAYTCYKIHVSDIYMKIPKDIQFFTKVMFLIVFIASLFLFDYGMDTSIFYSRFMRFSFIPASIVAAYFYGNRIYQKQIKIAIYMAIFGAFYAMIYIFYDRIVS